MTKILRNKKVIIVILEPHRMSECVKVMVLVCPVNLRELNEGSLLCVEFEPMDFE